MSAGEGLFRRMKRRLKANRTPEQAARLRRRFAEPLAVLSAGSLRRLAEIYGTDKWGVHWYCQHYERHFAAFRKRPITLLEIGIGGLDDPRAGGNSLRMWRRYFPRGRIVGIDIADKKAHEERRIRTFQGDQSDEAFLRRVIAEIGTPDIIIDDGSHLNEHVLKTFGVLFPLLADRGIYAVEDTQTSYWKSFGGSSENLTTAPTSMNLLKALADGINHKELEAPGRVPTYTDQHVVAVHFYHNLVFVRKGANDEASTRR